MSYVKQFGCPHCDPHSFALSKCLLETNNFRIVCDVHPLTEGHILVIPKKHISCVGNFDDRLFTEFKDLYYKISRFLVKTYGSVASFEHGIIGQTVFHAHTHLLPVPTKVVKIVPEGKRKLREITSLDSLREAFKKEKQYLFVSVGEKMFLLDCSLGKPRFFRDRFARVLNRPERGNWKTMEENRKLMSEADSETNNLMNKWNTRQRFFR